MADDIKRNLQAKLANVLMRHIEPIFKRGTEFTLIARTPGMPEADVLVTSDNLDEVAALIKRSKAREVIGAQDA